MPFAWLIIGASGHAQSLAAIIRGRGEKVAAVSDPLVAGLSEVQLAGHAQLVPFCNPGGVPPRYFSEDDEALAYAREKSLLIAIGIGDNALRARIAAAIALVPAHAALTAPLVAVTATVDSSAVLGSLCQVCEHAHVGPLARIGQATIVNTAAIVEHEAVVGAASHLAPGSVLLGAATVGDEVVLGSGARVLPGVLVGDRAVVGAGAVATRSLAGMTTYIGAPAQPLPTKGAVN